MGFFIDVFGKKTKRILALVLRLVHGLIGMVQQSFGIVAMFGIKRDSDAGPSRYFVTLEFKWFGGFFEQAFDFCDQRGKADIQRGQI